MNLFLKGLKIGFGINILLVLGLFLYVLTVENWLTKPIKPFAISLELGTIVDSKRLFEQPVPSMKLRQSWLNIQDKFNFFVIEYQLRQANYSNKSPRLMRWCKNNECFAHRINYLDSRINQFKVFTIDDWFSDSVLVVRDISNQTLRLNLFLRSLPAGSLVVISEPFSSFDRPQVFQKFSQWVLQLRADNPGLKFEIGLQVHLQWADAFWFKNWWILESFSKFSKIHDYPWGISEFSNYDQIWKRRIRGQSASDRLFYKIEGLIPRRLRCAVVLHGSYLIHRDAVRYGAVRFVEWGNIQQTAWFVRQIDAGYDSNYELFDRAGVPTSLWWAGMRGLKDGK